MKFTIHTDFQSTSHVNLLFFGDDCDCTLMSSFVFKQIGADRKNKNHQTIHRLKVAISTA